MSILEVKIWVTVLVDRAIFEDVSFRLLNENISVQSVPMVKGKSTFMSIVTKDASDEGKVEWSKYVTAGYLDQHAVLKALKLVRDVLRTALMSYLKSGEASYQWPHMEMAEDGWISMRWWNSWRTPRPFGVVISILWMLRLMK